MNFFAKQAPAVTTSLPSRRLRLASFAMAGMALAGLPWAGIAISPAIAQDAESGPQSTLSLPETMNGLGQSNPNLRRATAVVNGDIITGVSLSGRAFVYTSGSTWVGYP